MTEKTKVYTQKAVELRNEGRFDEAILASRKAIGLDERDANGWWQLALAQAEKDGPLAARTALKRVTELVPGFAAGWCELARASHKAGEHDAAAQQFEAALEADSGHTRSLISYEFLLKTRKGEGDNARRLQLLRQLEHQGDLSEDRHFDLAFLLAEAGEKLEAIHIYESLLQSRGTEATFFNVALLYRSVGRHADAFDAFTVSVEKAPGEQVNVEGRANALKRLQAVDEKIPDRWSPYLPPEDWYQHYVNPFMLLKTCDLADLQNDPKAFQKARQALYREIDLEDGKVEWVAGLSIDRSTAMAMLERLSNADHWTAHEKPFYDSSLRDFMERGTLVHFLPAAGSTDGGHSIARLAEVETLRILGPCFAAQFDLVLTKAISAGDIAVIECLLGGRRWVLPEHEELCFAGAKRALERLLEPIIAMHSQADERTIRRAEIELALKVSRLEDIIAHLPAEFHAIHRQFASLLRSFSVSLYNREGNAEEAIAILQWGKRCTTYSPAIAQQIEEDEKFLNEIISKERASEAHFSVKGQEFSITKYGITFGAAKIPATNCVGARWGSVQTAGNPATFRFRLAFTARGGAEIDVNWTTGLDLEAQEALFSSATSAIFAHILNPLLVNFRTRLRDGGTEQIGPLQVREGGVTFQVQGWWSSKEIKSEWRNLRSEISNGAVTIRDSTNPKCVVTLPFEQTNNAILLHIMCNPNGAFSA